MKVKSTNKDAVIKIEAFWFPLLLSVICLAEWFKNPHIVWLVIGTSTWVLMLMGVINLYVKRR